MSRPITSILPIKPSQRPRIVLYSHDTMGLGHVRRNQLIAKALAAPPLNANVLLITGIREAGAFPMSFGIDSLSLPAYHKGADGQYCARSLELGSGELAALRGQTIDTALAFFGPDVLIIDNVPGGALGEMLPALTRLRDGGETRIVLGLRDILDAPRTIAREWTQKRAFETIRAYYDDVWIYGDPALFETAREYDFPPDIAEKCHYTGLLDPLYAQDLPAENGVNGFLCIAGGGQDGFVLAKAFAEAPRPYGIEGIIVTGPFMPAAHQEELASIAARRSGLRIIPMVSNPLPLIAKARGVVAMAGYNSVNEILALGKPALLAPRTSPRTEQLIRAETLRSFGLADYIIGDAINPETIGQWMGNVPHLNVKNRQKLDFGGLGRIVDRAMMHADIPCHQPLAIDQPIPSIRIIAHG